MADNRPLFLASEQMYSPSNVKINLDPPIPKIPATTQPQAPVAAELNITMPVDPIDETPYSDMMRFKSDLISKAMRLLGPQRATAETYRMLSEAPLGDVMELVDRLTPKSAK